MDDLYPEFLKQFAKYYSPNRKPDTEINVPHKFMSEVHEKLYILLLQYLPSNRHLEIVERTSDEFIFKINLQNNHYVECRFVAGKLIIDVCKVVHNQHLYNFSPMHLTEASIRFNCYFQIGDEYPFKEIILTLDKTVL